ncbi:MAG: hypothetical protein ACYDHN_13995 [Solirubrobacteraceae bacterium]
MTGIWSSASSLSDFGRYQHESRATALVHAEYLQLKAARDVLAWNPLKKAMRGAQVTEARGRLRGWLYHREAGS